MVRSAKLKASLKITETFKKKKLVKPEPPLKRFKPKEPTKVKSNNKRSVIKAKQPTCKESVRNLGLLSGNDQVEKVLNARKFKGRIQYLVRWEGLEEAYDSWVFSSQIRDKELIKQYRVISSTRIETREGTGNEPSIKKQRLKVKSSGRKTKKQAIREAREALIAARKKSPFPSDPHPRTDPKSLNGLCCLVCSSRLFFEALNMNTDTGDSKDKRNDDAKESAIKELFNSANNARTKVAKFFYGTPPDAITENALTLAIEQGRQDMLSDLTKDCEKYTGHQRAKPSSEALKDPSSGTGFISRNTFRHAVKEVNESRGNREGNTAFYRKESKEAMQLHRDKFSIDRKDIKNETLLHVLATRKISKDMIKWLMARSFSYADTLTNFGVYEAAAAGDRATVATLLSAIGENEGFNLLHREVVQSAEVLPLSKFKSVQVSKKAISNRQIRPTHLAAIHPEAAYLKQLMDSVDSENFLLEDGFSRTVAHFAAVAESPNCLQLLVDNGIPIDPKDTFKMTPIMLCAMHGRHLNLGIFVKELGQEIVNTKHPRYGWAPLHFAAHYGQSEMVKLLLSNEAKVDAHDKESKGTPLHHAVKMGHFDTVKMLIREGNANPDIKDKFNRTPLHLAAKNGRYDIAQFFLVECGVDANAKDTSDNTPLHYAAAYGWLNLIQLLIMVGHAEVNAKNNWKTTPLAIADSKGHISVANFFLDHPQVDPGFRNRMDMTLFHQYVTAHPRDWYEANRLMDKANKLTSKNCPSIYEGDADGNTPLHLLCGSPYYVANHTEIPGVNEEYGLDDEQKNHYQALRITNQLFGKFDDGHGSHIQAQLAELCLKQISDPMTLTNKKGQTPMIIAINSGHLDMVLRLLDYMSPDQSLKLRYGELHNNLAHFIMRQAAKLQNEFYLWKPSDSIERNRLQRCKERLNKLLDKLVDGSKDVMQLLFEEVNDDGVPPVLEGLIHGYKLQTKSAHGSGCRSFGLFNKAEITAARMELKWDYMGEFLNNVISKVSPNLNIQQQLPKKFDVSKESPSSEPEYSGWTALHYATKACAVPVIKTLLNNGRVDVEIRSWGYLDGFSALSLAVNLDKKMISNRTLFSSQLKRYSDESFTRPTHLYQSVVDALLEAGANPFIMPQLPENRYPVKPDYIPTRIIKFDQSPFITLLDNQPLHIVEKVLKNYETRHSKEALEGKLNLPGTLSNGLTPLMVAMSNIGKLKLLCKYSLNPNSVDKLGNTATMIAIKNKHLVALQFLSWNNSYIDLTPVNQQGDTALTLAGVNNCMEYLYAHINKHSIQNINHQDGNGRTAIFWASFNNKTAIIQKLVQIGGDTNLSCYDTQDSPLMATIYSNLKAQDSFAVVKTLISGGASVNTPNNTQDTPLHRATNKSDFELANLLLLNGANTNAQNKMLDTPLHIAVKKLDFELVNLLLLNGANTNAQNKMLDTPLHIAVKKLDFELVNLLLLNGANVNAKDIYDITPLHLAIANSLTQNDLNLDMEQLLVKHGADINSKDYQGRSPLHYCFNTMDLIPLMCYTESMKGSTTKVFGEKIESDSIPAKAHLNPLELSKFNKNDPQPKSFNSFICNNQGTFMASRDNPSLKWGLDGSRRSPNWETSYLTAKKDPIELISFFLKQPNLNVDVLDEFGRSPLHYAARVGAFTSSSYLIDRGQAELKLLDKDGLNPFHLALLYNHIEHAVTLFNHHQFVGYIQPDMVLPYKNNGKPVTISPLSYTLSKSYMPLAYMILDNQPSDVITKIKAKLHAGKLHMAYQDVMFSSLDQLQALQPETQHNLAHALVSFSVSPSQATFSTWMKYLPDLTSRLLNVGCHLLQSKDHLGQSPLILSILNRQTELSLKFIDYDSSLDHLHISDHNNRTALWHAVNLGNHQIVSHLLQANCDLKIDYGIDVQKNFSVTYLAVKSTPFPLVAELMDRGGNPNLDESFGRTGALFRVLFQNQLKELDRLNLWELLVKHGAHLNQPGWVCPHNISNEPYVSLCNHDQDIKKKNLILMPPTWLIINSSQYSLMSQLEFIKGGLTMNLIHPITHQPFLCYISDKMSCPDITYLESYLNYSDVDPYYSINPDKPSYLEALLIGQLSKPKGFQPLSGWTVLWDKLKQLGTINSHPRPLIQSILTNRMSKWDELERKRLIERVLSLGVFINRQDIILALQHNAYDIIEMFLNHSSFDAKLWDDLSLINRLIMSCPISSFKNTKLIKLVLTTISGKFDLKKLLTSPLGGLSFIQRIEKFKLYSDVELMKQLIDLGCTIDCTEDMEVDEVQKLDNVISTDTIELDAQFAKQQLIQHQQELDSSKKKYSLPLEMRLVAEKSDVNGVGVIAKGKKGELLNSLMHRTEFSGSWHTSDMFYQLQLIHNPVSDLYILFTRWGNTDQYEFGGMHQRTPFSTYDEGYTEFIKVYKAKSGNIWLDSEPFLPKAGRFVPVKVENEKVKLNFSEVFNLINSKLKSSSSNLPEELQFLVRLFCDAALSATCNNNRQFILPNSRAIEDQAKELLNNIKLIISNINELKDSCVNKSDDIIQLKHQLFALNSQYYTLVPKTEGHRLSTNSSLKAIKDLSKWTKEALRFDQLKYLDGGKNLILGASRQPSPTDYIYHGINCHIESIDVNNEDPWVNLAKKYIDSSQSSYELVKLFKLNRPDDEARFQPFANEGNNKLLWHGTKMQNMLGVLSQGLRIAPIEAPSTGYMFGKGLYFADVFKKSINYASGDPSGYSCLMLCEVALGKSYQRIDSEYIEGGPKPNFDSTFGLGQMMPQPHLDQWVGHQLNVPVGNLAESMVLDKEIDIFNSRIDKHHELEYEYEDCSTEESCNSGESSASDDDYSIRQTKRVKKRRLVSKKYRSSALMYNEYVVYDPARVRMKLLVLVKPKGHTSSVF